MSNPRLVKVFLASSITELKDELQVLSALGDDISNIFNRDEIVVQIVKWENFPKNVNSHGQENIDQTLRDCDIFLFVIKTKVGAWTRHEYAVAHALMQQKKHGIIVCFLRVPYGEKDPSVTDFQQQLRKDGVYWKECNTPGEVKYEFSMGILNHLGITVGGRSAEAKAAEERFKQFEQTAAQKHQQLHQDIDELLAQIPAILDDESQLISTRIVEVMALYQKADRWASKTSYDKKKYIHLLYDYAKFLNKYGMYYDAEAVFLRLIPLAEDLYGKDHPNTATSYDNIGMVYWRKGNYPKALEYYGKALAIYEKVLGKDHPDTAQSYNNIGLVYHEQGDYPKALEYFRKALAIDEKVLGKDHPSTAASCNNIGLVYYDQGDYAKALEYFWKALDIRKRVLGSDHPDTAGSYNNIGFVYYSQGDYDKALEYLGKALDIRERVLGLDHPDTASSYNNIGFVYYNQGDYAEVMKYYKKALDIRERVLGPDHPDTTKSYRYMGLVNDKIGNHSKAMEWYEKSLNVKSLNVKEPVFNKGADDTDNIDFNNSILNDVSTSVVGQKQILDDTVRNKGYYDSKTKKYRVNIASLLLGAT